MERHHPLCSHLPSHNQDRTQGQGRGEGLTPQGRGRGEELLASSPRVCLWVTADCTGPRLLAEGSGSSWAHCLCSLCLLSLRCVGPGDPQSGAGLLSLAGAPGLGPHSHTTGAPQGPCYPYTCTDSASRVREGACPQGSQEFPTQLPGQRPSQCPQHCSDTPTLQST